MSILPVMSDDALLLSKEINAVPGHDPILPEDVPEILPDKQDSSKIEHSIEDAHHRGGEKRRRQSDETLPPTDGQKRKRERGQNKGRKFANSHDEVRLCPHIAVGRACPQGPGACRFEHQISLYLAQKPPANPGTCPVFARTGACDAGFRCRWLPSHVACPDESDPGTWTLTSLPYDAVRDRDFQNTLSKDIMVRLRKRQYPLPQSDTYLAHLDTLVDGEGVAQPDAPDCPLRAVEKRRLDWRGAKVLAPLTTTGNLPFRQLCRDFGADVTYSEMAVSAPLLQGGGSEWALTRSHASERDVRGGRSGMYGVQIAGPKPGVTVKAAEVLAAEMGSTLDFIDLNCGCPIDLIFKSGAGSALLDMQGKLSKMLQGMSLVSGPVPITCKIRTGVSDKKHTAGKLLARLNTEACVSMVTLHGRSRQQRYSRNADWSYIAECAAQIKSYTAQLADNDSRGRQAEFGYEHSMAFLGNGDIYTYEDWNAHMTSGVDGCMIARGALIKPWIFEEIREQRHIDKSASERLAMLGTYCANGLAYWGADQMGVDKTRRFMLEFMSFHHRYTPVGLLPQGVPLPMNERPPVVVYRNDMEKLLASESCDDWITVSDMFLGKASHQFKFLPKHKSNAIEAEG